MIRAGALRELVDLVARTPGPARDRYNNPIEVETTTPNVRAAVQVLDATEDEVSQDQRIQRYRVTIEPTVVVNGLAAIVWRGRRLEILGEPLEYTAKGESHHYEFDVREVLG